MIMKILGIFLTLQFWPEDDILIMNLIGLIIDDHRITPGERTD